MSEELSKGDFAKSCVHGQASRWGRVVRVQDNGLVALEVWNERLGRFAKGDKVIHPTYLTKIDPPKEVAPPATSSVPPLAYINTIFWILRMPEEVLEGPFPRVPTEPVNGRPLGPDDQILTAPVGNWTKMLGWTADQKKLRAERSKVAIPSRKA
jgi:hypothetical protein